MSINAGTAPSGLNQHLNSPREPGLKKCQYEPPGALELLHLINFNLIKSTLVSGDVHRKDWSSDLYKDQEGLYNCRLTR